RRVRSQRGGLVPGLRKNSFLKNLEQGRRRGLLANFAMRFGSGGGDRFTKVFCRRGRRRAGGAGWLWRWSPARWPWWSWRRWRCGITLKRRAVSDRYFQFHSDGGQQRVDARPTAVSFRRGYWTQHFLCSAGGTAGGVGANSVCGARDSDADSAGPVAGGGARAC